MLFSLNQYAWDVASSWQASVDKILADASSSRTRQDSLFISFLNQNEGARSIFAADSLMDDVHLVSTVHGFTSSHALSAATIRASLQASAEQVQHLFRLETSRYRKIAPISIGDSASHLLALVFVSGYSREKVLIGIVIDAEQFIRDVLGQKLTEAARENLLLGVSHQGSDKFVFTTGVMSPTEIQQSKPLWLFPDYLLGIRLKGQTIDELARARFYRNLTLIVLLDVVLIAGAWFVYRTVKREVELAQLKSDFVSNVSHELKTPLALIRMFGETLQMKRVPTEEKRQEYYNTIVQESERLTRLVNNILSFSRIEAGRKDYHFAPADLNAIVRNVLKSYESQLSHLGFTVSINLKDGLPGINADAEAISESLLNIIDNAVKYSPTDKQITISTGSGDGRAYVEVKDRGIGIASHHHKKIFDKFYRVSSGLVHNTKGSGLGLTLVKHIADAHMGEITVTSELGQGSVFRLSFPATNQQIDSA